MPSITTSPAEGSRLATVGMEGSGVGDVSGRLIKCACDSFEFRCLPGLDYCLTNYTCFAAVFHDSDDDDTSDVTATMGCLGERDSADMNCHVGTQQHLSISCCRGSDFCNQDLLNQLTSTDSPIDGVSVHRLQWWSPALEQVLYCAISILLVLILLTLVIWRLLHHRHRRRIAAIKARERILPLVSNSSSEKVLSLVSSSSTDEELKRISPSTSSCSCDSSCSSSCSSKTAKTFCELSVETRCESQSLLYYQRDLPYLHHQQHHQQHNQQHHQGHSSLGQSVHLLRLIHKGRYSDIWQGMLQGNTVAVRVYEVHHPPKLNCVFNTWQLQVQQFPWQRELEIRHTVLPHGRHDGKVIAADYVKKNSLEISQFWLVTRCYSDGSLGDRLRGNRPIESARKMMRLLSSAARGLAYLHESGDNNGKLPAAHCNLTPNKFLVTSEGECRLENFSTAVILGESEGMVNLETIYRDSDVRYLAPEALSQKRLSFDGLMVADVYSFGLIMWETIRRCQVSGVAEEYKPVYYEFTPANSNKDLMRQIICVEKRRPMASAHWNSNQTLSGLYKLMSECWSHDPSSRPTMQDICRALNRLGRSLDDKDDNATSERT